MDQDFVRLFHIVAGGEVRGRGLGVLKGGDWGLKEPDGEFTIPFLGQGDRHV